jgi:cytoskeletal protein CcmA (bactofilin family)
MLKSEKFFGKRESVAEVKPFAPVAPLSEKPATPIGLTIATPAVTSVPRVVPASIANVPSAAMGATAAGNGEMRSKLTVGPNIKLKGVEITDCDTLVVEGRVEATIDSRVIQISEKGAFVGIAEFDIAEIRGEFEGDLTVRQKLVVYSSGRVTGKVRYGKLVIEEGGQLAGDVQLTSSTAKALAVAAG